MSSVKPIITPEELLAHWQGHRNLTRRFIEAFPEKNYLNFPLEACVRLPIWLKNFFL